MPRPPSPQTLPPALPEGPRGVPRPAERHSLSSVSWVFPWASSRWGMPGTPLLSPFDVAEQRLYSKLLPGDRAPYPISKGAPRHPSEEAHFGRLYPGSYPFGHDPELMTIGFPAVMNWAFLENVLSGVNKYSTAIGRIWLSVLFIFRILVFVAAAENVWKDESKDFVCNTQQPGCENVCFDRFFPVSQARLWALQLIMVSTPSLLVALHVAYRENREKKHGRKLYEDRGRIDGGLLFTYLFSLVLKTTFEVGTLLIFYFVYNGFSVPRMYRCEEIPCPNTVDCYISKATEKKIFLYIMGCTSVLCVVLNLTEMIYILSKQCWKCFSQRYVPVEQKRTCSCHAHYTSALALGSAGPKAVTSASKENEVQFQSSQTVKGTLP
ncbi:hypothetical protein QTP86_013069 [Hemibagrus guttatus]|nr:hypothetical protein QTP86_013069 [Hemibagrus guttatus]